MPIQDIIQKHFTAADQTSFNTLIAPLEALFQPKTQNLSEEENKEYGSINETNKLMVNKVSDFSVNQPALRSPDVDWTEFAADGFDRKFLEGCALRLDALSRIITETRRLHDFDNFQNALVDYHYTEYKAGTQPGMGYDVKLEELKQFFK